MAGEVLKHLRATLLLVASLVASPALGQACEPATWMRLESGAAPATRDEVIEAMARRDVVLLGETHDNADHHRWQLHTLSALHLLRPRMAIGFEAFPRAAQPALERWVRGELTFERFLVETRWREVWNMDPELYRPLFEYARLNRVPMIALNVSKAEREAVARVAPAPQAYLDHLGEVFHSHRKEGQAKAEDNAQAFEAFVRAQQAWDRAFAEGLAAQAGREGSGTLAVGIIGSGHLRHGHGVALQLRDLGVPRVGTLLPLQAPQDCDELKPGLADAAFLLAERAKPAAPRPRLGVQVEQQGERVLLAGVVADSLAERSGLREGDQIVAVAGKPLTRAVDFVDAVRGQPAGTWLPLQVRRGDALEQLVVRFPPEK